MLKKLKIATRVISFILSLILMYQASPIDAIAATIADLSASQSADSNNQGTVL